MPKLLLKIKDTEFLFNASVRKTNKITLRVKGRDLYLTLPPKVIKKDLISFLEQNYNVLKQAVLVEKILHLWGKKYFLKTEIKNRPNVYEKDEFIIVETLSLDDDVIKDLLKQFYLYKLKEYLKFNFSNILTKILENPELKEKLQGYQFKQKWAKSYFAECNVRNRIITLSAKLAQYDSKFIEPIIYHELAHLYELNHGSGFYRVVNRIYPNYDIYLKELKLRQKEHSKDFI